MRLPRVPEISSKYVVELCKQVAPTDTPILVPHEPLADKPLMECFSIVPEHIATHGGKQLTGWALWEVPGVYIEAEFHCVWQDTQGVLHDLTPRPIPFERTLFLPDSRREYRGRQVDNVRQPLVNDRDVFRMLYLAKRIFEIMNAGDLANQHGEIQLPPKAAKEYWNVQKEMAQLKLRLDRRYP